MELWNAPKHWKISDDPEVLAYTTNITLLRPIGAPALKVSIIAYPERPYPFCIHLEQATRVCFIFAPWASMLVSAPDPYNKLGNPMLPLMVRKGVIQPQDIVFISQGYW